MKNIIYLLLLLLSINTMISCDKDEDYDSKKLREEFYVDLNCKEPEYKKFLEIKSVYRDQTGNTYIASRYGDEGSVLAKYNDDGNNIWKKIFKTENEFYDTGFGEQRENYEIVEINAVIDGALVLYFRNTNSEFNKIKLFNYDGEEVRSYPMNHGTAYSVFQWSNKEFIVEKINHSTNEPVYEMQDIKGVSQSYENLYTDGFYNEYARINENEYLSAKFINTNHGSFDNYFDIAKFFFKAVNKEDWTEGDFNESVKISHNDVLSGDESFKIELPLNIDKDTRSRILNYDINENYFKIKFEIWYKDNTRKIIEYKVNNHTGEIDTL